MIFKIFSITNPFIVNDYIGYCKGDIDQKIKQYEHDFNRYMNYIEAPYDYAFEWMRGGDFHIKLLKTIECNDENEVIELIKQIKFKPKISI